MISINLFVEICRHMRLSEEPDFYDYLLATTTEPANILIVQMNLLLYPLWSRRGGQL